MSVTPPDQPAESGYLSKSGSPALKISIWGVDRQFAKEFEAIIDTGFTGFLSMPLMQAFPLGLILFGTTKVVLADGSTDTKLTALGTVGLGAASKMGVIILEPGSSEILIGMEFLNQFERTLLVFGERAIPIAAGKANPVLLIQNKAVHAILEAIVKHVASLAVTQTAAPPPSLPPAAEGAPGSEPPPAPQQ